MPLRLILLLLVGLLSMVVLLGNPLAVPLQLLFWQSKVELYKLILVSIGVGIFMTLLFVSHVHSLRNLHKKSKQNKQKMK